MTLLRVGGIVLCGGQSSRMGTSKAWLPFGGETMLQRVVRRLGQTVDPIVVVAAPGQEVPELPAGVILVRDEEKGRGPLQGLAAGLASLRGRVDAVFASSCDVPFVSPAVVKRLVTLLGDHAICMPLVGGHHHPLAAVYRMEVEQIIAQLLAANRLRPYFLLETARARIVTEVELSDADPELQSFRNVNTREDYEAALKLTAE